MKYFVNKAVLTDSRNINKGEGFMEEFELNIENRTALGTSASQKY